MSSMSFIYLNRKGAKDAKGDVCWVVLILKKEQNQNRPSPAGGQGRRLLSTSWRSWRLERSGRFVLVEPQGEDGDVHDFMRFDHSFLVLPQRNRGDSCFTRLRLLEMLKIRFFLSLLAVIPQRVWTGLE